MNLSGFKKLKEDKKTVTMAHPLGHTITIFKSKISPEQRKRLEKLPMHMDEGGGVSAEDQAYQNRQQGLSNFVDSVKNVFAGSDANAGEAPKGDASSNSDYAVDNSTDAPSADVSHETIPVTDSSQTAAQAPLPNQGQPVVDSKPVDTSSLSSGNTDELNKAYKQGQQGIEEQRAYESSLAQNQLAVQQQDLSDRKQLLADQQAATKAFQTHQQALLDDYANGHINPNHYQENMSTGSKVATAIGLILGGLSGGGSHTTNNPAAEWLNAQITRDIDAQKATMDQKKTLLGANQELYHDGQVAYEQTRIAMNNIYDHQIQMEANKLGTDRAKAAADQAHAKFATENAALLQSSSNRAAVLQGLKNGNLDPGAAVEAYIPADQRKEAYNDLKDYQNKSALRKNIISAFNKVANNRTVFQDPTFRNSAQNALNAGIAELAKDATGRFNEVEAQKLREQFKPGFFDSPKALHSRLGDLDAQLQQKMNYPSLHRIMPLLEQQNARMQGAESASSKPQYTVGQVVYVNGQKGQVLPDGRIRAIK